MSEHPTRFQLEAWSVGEKDTTVSAHIETCTDCSNYVASLVQQQDTFLARESPDDFVRQVRMRVENEATPSRGLRMLWWAVPVAALAALLVVFRFSPQHADPTPGLRIKGNLGVAVIIKRAGEQMRFENSATIQSGDQIRFEVTLPKTMQLTLGIVQPDGSWIPIVENKSFTAGVHLLQRALAVDNNVEPATVIAGATDEVSAARDTGQYEKVSVLKLNRR